METQFVLSSLNDSPYFTVLNSIPDAVRCNMAYLLRLLVDDGRLPGDVVLYPARLVLVHLVAGSGRSEGTVPRTLQIHQAGHSTVF